MTYVICSVFVLKGEIKALATKIFKKGLILEVNFQKNPIALNSLFPWPREDFQRIGSSHFEAGLPNVLFSNQKSRFG
jgi:hypothetical protein